VSGRGGEVRADACGAGQKPIRAGVSDTKLCCTSTGFVTAEECDAMGGQALADPGDGSLKHCPGDGALIAAVEGFIEGGLCCIQ
jgi:hypothetical protein